MNTMYNNNDQRVFATYEKLNEFQTNYQPQEKKISTFYT